MSVALLAEYLVRPSMFNSLMDAVERRTDWLLEESNPHVRYFALRWLLGQSESKKHVANTKQAIAQSAPVQKIIQLQRPEGYWGSDARPHYGTRGPLMLLMWLGAPKNIAIEKAMDYRINGGILEEGAYCISKS